MNSLIPGNDSGDELTTPIIAKTSDQQGLPARTSSYFVLANNGLWLCRNHEFFRSSVPARRWPSELAPHQAQLRLRHPRLPRRMVEQMVGFFSTVAREYQAEAGVLLLWDETARRLRMYIPPQVAGVGVSWNGHRYPRDLHYEIPSDLPVSRRVVGDVHSHVYESAYSSAMDREDEEHRPGLHLVVGRLDREPPDFHAEYVIDGTRFSFPPEQILKGYTRRKQTTPASWLEQVRVREYRSDFRGDYA